MEQDYFRLTEQDQKDLKKLLELDYTIMNALEGFDGAQLAYLRLRHKFFQRLMEEQTKSVDQWRGQ